MAVLVAPLVFRAPRGAGLLDAPVGGGPPASRPRREPLARRVGSKPGQAPPPPTGTAAVPSGPSGALHTSGAWCAVGCFGASFRSSARPSLRPRPPPPGPVGRLGRWSETIVTFACWYLWGIETAIAFAGEKWACLGQFSDAEAMPVSVAPSWGRTEASSVSKSPCFCVLRAKFFAPTSPAPVLDAARRSPHC